MTKETKLTEPVQVGLWYQTKAGAITQMTNERSLGVFSANNGHVYLSDGKNRDSSVRNGILIKCLGADPFNQVVSETTVFQKNPCMMMTDKGLVPVSDPFNQRDDVVFATIPPKTGKLGDKPSAVGFAEAAMNPSTYPEQPPSTVGVFKPATPTLHDQVAMLLCRGCWLIETTLFLQQRLRLKIALNTPTSLCARKTKGSKSNDR